ncbi:MAG: rane-bound lytic murein transglycosylase [Acidobacteriota bacterium]|jgi:membrane-bound lytic murein transglycosylase D|nr:rane-bound lytic murein transglycosylase [Acidobacteriota bacterium]
MHRNLLCLTLLVAAACASAPSSPTAAPATAAAPPPVAANRDVLADLPHDRVDYWVERFGRGDKHAEIAEALGRKPQYDAMIADKLRRKGMPQELIYLAMNESGFNVQAHSVAEAIGIWQLVPDTARRYGLKVDETVDERRDPEKSTDAALSYLASLYNRFGSWYLAAAAYNTGENRVARIMTEVTGSERGTDADYYRIWDRLAPETRDFIPAMVALARIGKDPARYGF